MDFKINTTKKKFNFHVTVKTNELQYIKCHIFDTNNKLLIYADREICIENKHIFNFSFPFIPSDSLTVSVYNLQNGNLDFGKDKSFSVTFKVKHFTPIEIDGLPIINSFEKINKIHKLQSKKLT